MTGLLETASKLPGERPVAPATARATMAAIEAERVALRLSVEALARLAGMSTRSYQRYASGARVPAGADLRRLARALAGGDPQRERDGGLLRALAVRMLEELARRQAAPRPRNLAIYLAHVELGLPQRQIARLFGVSSNRIHVVVRQVEEQRDDGTATDKALLQLCSLLDAGADGFIGRAGA
ncbi:helix-turn-helix domain-containing protein [Bosea sp. (in: a-proteobacteria)]|uniref:helix-turn-helix domain-containing protein n=1 Tax=Bosea sp. (in: a-proteobacteria) TaxID=1871050 RepID=UPI0026240854|nr:helix-turn-helix domain-containing protein [Bosea sp. (in: a-proteobacteria)]MCO5091973.1 helix-turn-helix domain-containing protein [Bosea sp. (in: a-proteobacteria)]